MCCVRIGVREPVRITSDSWTEHEPNISYRTHDTRRMRGRDGHRTDHHSPISFRHQNARSLN